MDFRSSCDGQAGVGRLGTAVDVRGGEDRRVSFIEIKRIRLGVDLLVTVHDRAAMQMGHLCRVGDSCRLNPQS
eukprot:4435925-Prymnesium_polylepis.1